MTEIDLHKLRNEVKSIKSVLIRLITSLQDGSSDSEQWERDIEAMLLKLADKV